MLPNLNSLPVDNGLSPALEKAIQNEFRFVYDDEWETAKAMVWNYVADKTKQPADDCEEFVNIALEDSELENKLAKDM